MARGKARPPHRADTRGAGFTGLPQAVQDSPAYRDCSLWARAVLLEIIREFNGFNNGEIFLSVDQICERLNNSNRRKACRAVAELMEHGLIDVAAEGKWRERKAREFRLTFVSSGKFPAIRPATNDYRKWEAPKKNNGDASSPRKGETGDAVSPDAPRAGNALSPVEKPNRRKTAVFGPLADAVTGDAVSLHIFKPYHSPKEGDAISDLPPDLEAQKIGGPSASDARPETLAMLARLRGREAVT